MTITEFDNNTETGTEKTGRVAGVKNKARDAYSSTRERTSAAYGTARERASSARQRTSQGIDTNPFGALIGGLAVGALIAAVLPKSRREEELLGNYGKKINQTAKEAARAAKDAGKDKLDELGLNQETAKQKLGDIASKAGEAARTSASAAAQTVKGSQSQQQPQ